jgi:hypothetical protein
MNYLGSFEKLSVKISREAIHHPNRNNGHSYRYLATCDELPGCCGHGATINEAFNDFCETAGLWLSWFGR